jgi:hypothetical protein
MCKNNEARLEVEIQPLRNCPQSLAASAAAVIIPVVGAQLCINCNCIISQSNICPACGSKQVFSLQKFLDRREIE